MQLVSYARNYEEFEKRGTRIVGISVDPPEHNKAMVEKLALPFSLLSDPTAVVKTVDQPYGSRSARRSHGRLCR
jgi:peroxiredoxin